MNINTTHGSGFNNQTVEGTIKEVTLNIKNTKALDVLRSAQADVIAGLSYNAVSRKYGLDKDTVKSLKPRTTGKFFASVNKGGFRVIVAERIDPLTGMSNAPMGTPLFNNAAQVGLYSNRKGALR